MSAPYFVELLNNHNQVTIRYRFDTLPIRIGRAYDNDLILDDAYIAPYHAKVQLNETGHIEINDTGSKNGIVYQNQRRPIMLLHGQEVLQLGHTNIRIRAANFVVESELLDKKTYEWDGLTAALTGLAMIATSTFIGSWLTLVEQASTVSHLFAILIVLALVLVWSGCWAFANRVLSGQLRFGRHLFIAATALVITDCWEATSLSLAYIFSLEFLTRYGSHMYMVIAGGMLFYHLYTIHQQHPKRLIKISAALALLGSSVILMANYQRNGNLADELYMSHLLPPSLKLSGNQRVSDFLQDATSLKTTLDIERLKPAKNNNGLLP